MPQPQNLEDEATMPPSGGIVVLRQGFLIPASVARFGTRASMGLPRPNLPDASSS
jgi:hypothetical protein